MDNVNDPTLVDIQIDEDSFYGVDGDETLVETIPDHVFSKPESTTLPPFLFSGANFALIPSRDEPSGLVVVVFGRKGALGLGSRAGGLSLMPGGLGLMPGWVGGQVWFYHSHPHLSSPRFQPISAPGVIFPSSN